MRDEKTISAGNRNCERKQELLLTPSQGGSCLKGKGGGGKPLSKEKEESRNPYNVHSFSSGKKRG